LSLLGDCPLLQAGKGIGNALTKPQGVGQSGQESAANSLRTDQSAAVSEKQALSRKDGLRIDLVDEQGNVIVPDDNISYPPNRGFLLEPKRETLQPGTMLDRYGSESGRFVSPKDVPASARSLPPGVANSKLHTYQVLKPFDVYGGPAAPAFNQPGGGIQYELNRSVKDLIIEGYLKRVE
jgi:hypothetical protein